MNCEPNFNARYCAARCKVFTQVLPTQVTGISILQMKRIKLTQGKWALVDDDNFEWLNSYKWHAYEMNGLWYAGKYLSKDKHSIGMHRFILNPPVGMIVDHINHNGLDNRLSNIRICTRTENARNNRKRKSKSTSKYKGVSWNRQLNAWTAYIMLNKDLIALGKFSNEDDAARAYNKAALIYHKEFACLNKIKRPVRLTITYTLPKGKKNGR